MWSSPRFGVGYGVGVKDAICTTEGGYWYGQNELGHIGLTRPPMTDQMHLAWYDDFVSFLTQHPVAQLAPLTFETVLSGAGFAWIYQFVTGSSESLTPRQAQQALDENLAVKNQVLSLLAYFLGLFVGTLELIFMPSGGIYIGGGVIKKNLALFSSPVIEHFWSGVNSSNAYQSLRQAFPLAVMVEDESVYLGGAFYAEQAYLSRIPSSME
jgi:glucokinase